MNFPAASSEDLLFDAARRGDVSALRSLLATGLAVDMANANGFTPLVLAAYDNQAEATAFLLGAGANPNAQDVAGNTALMGVSFRGYPGVAQFLI